jgi:hypothetical protein
VQPRGEHGRALEAGYEEVNLARPPLPGKAHR